jgi:hypothetical protein
LAQKINDNGCLKGTTTQIFFTRRLMVRKGKKDIFTWSMRSQTQDGKFPRGGGSPRRPDPNGVGAGAKSPPWGKRGRVSKC